MRSLFSLPLLTLLAACGTNYSEIELNELDDLSQGLTGDGLLYPFPNNHLVRDGNLEIPADLLPWTESGIPTDTIAWRTGFSPVQTAVVLIDNVDKYELPSWHDPVAGESGVRLIDLTTGEYLPVMAELDAYCAYEDPEFTGDCATWPDDEPALLIRPQKVVPHGHRAAVVIMTDAADRPNRFDRLVTGDAPNDFKHRASYYEDLLDEIDSAVGIDPDNVALAWDYQVGDGTRPMRSAIEQIETASDWTIANVRNLDDGDSVTKYGWRAADGTFTVPNFLLEDTNLVVDNSGNVTQQGDDEAYFWVHIPESVKDAPLRSVPVIVVGHGIFGDVRDFLDLGNGVNGFTQVSHDEGYILIGTNLRGLDWNDRVGAVDTARDFGKVSQIPDRMVQGQVNVRALIEMLKAGDFLADPEHVFYWGVSMGGILGGVTVGTGAPVDSAVLHIAGSSWSTMLERSGAWTAFEIYMVDSVANPTDRQLLYSVSQLWWDQADPIAYTDDLAATSFILQENKGDESVSNVGTRMLARSVDLPLLAPANEPEGFTLAEGPLEAGSSAYVQFDPRRGDPEDANRPATTGGAHGASFMWPGTRAQTAHFFETGEIKHFCGTSVCSRVNTGSAE